MRKVIIAGGPCSGKTSTLEELARRGYATLGEAARDIIREEQRKAVLDACYEPIVPWNNIAKFQTLVVERQIQNEARLCPGKTVLDTAFLDRGLVDGLAYAQLAGVAIEPQALAAIVTASYERVFVLDTLPRYVNDAERKESEEQARGIQEAIMQAYDRWGFYVTLVRVMSIRERVDFIEQEVLQEQNREREIKIPVPELETIAQRCEQEGFVFASRDDEQNRVTYWPWGGWTVRTRHIQNRDEYLLTIKGPNRGTEVKDQWEKNMPLSPRVARMVQALQFLFPVQRYDKIRWMYHPFGDRNTPICLDEVPGVGCFVEIESRSIAQIERWKNRLGITGKHMPLSYAQLVQKAEYRQERRDDEHDGTTNYQNSQQSHGDGTGIFPTAV